MKKSVDRCHQAAKRKYEAMCGTPLDQVLNRIEAGKFAVLVGSGIVIPTDVEYAVLDADVDMRFLEDFEQRWW